VSDSLETPAATVIGVPSRNDARVRPLGAGPFGRLDPPFPRAYAASSRNESGSRVEETSPMPHNMFFGVSNYVSLGVVIVVVIVVVGFWWLRTGRR
jgi:hypothetical protein